MYIAYLFIVNILYYYFVLLQIAVIGSSMY